MLNKILATAEITKNDFVIEIGAGIGTLTQYLAYAAREICAVEIDHNLIPILKDTLSDWNNITVIHEDILKLDLNNLVNNKNGGKPIKIVANLPYYITTPIIMGLFEDHVPVDTITVMVQKEVASRMQARPGSKDYGAFSLAIQYYAELYLAAKVSPKCFIPRPKVDSAVIRLKNKVSKVSDEALMFHLIRASFNQRRKTLLNALCNDKGLSFQKEVLDIALVACGLPSNVRGETLTLKQFAALAAYLKNKEE